MTISGLLSPNCARFPAASAAFRAKFTPYRLICIGAGAVPKELGSESVLDVGCNGGFRYSLP